ncbi:hypothetical protein Tco_0681545 [Tanacetum coccineum]|uniref:Uncharacterized protein n=1 Tax=Tanacetum coccineum TaxID=301880 RepID=A0ABQ4XPL0_9ASTR
METKDIISSCSDSEEHEMQQMQKQAKTLCEQEIKKILKMLNDRNLQTQECKVQEVKTADASSGNTNNSGIVSNRGNTNSSENDCSKTGNDQSSGNQSNISWNESSRSRNESSRPGNECAKK